ncbi:Adenylate cyclase 1 [Rubripirellula tenax]|uniref:Adenylate cyclase 1 n=1 Tax=Rubripirellula tenax TaxID=2528015 RepID=A0A5C6FIC4_9BACT|nr:adenylate/guanylate cyclase domain-containing protein [Rubripirellula tenax]TWU60660.1 Adenylate cyclase 1 [Rubripirellula tenax]
MPDFQDRAKPQWSFLQRHGLLFVCTSPLVANAIGSLFNVLYNRNQIFPILSDAQRIRFDDCVLWFNVLIYPIAVLCFVLPLVWVRPVYRDLLARNPVSTDLLRRAQRVVVNLPWWFLLVASLGWLSCIPVFITSLYVLPEPLLGVVIAHLVTSFLIAAMIAVTHSFFAVELAIQHALFPVVFSSEDPTIETMPASVPGIIPLNITLRGVLWTVSSVVSPVISLVLILLLPDDENLAPWFAVAVGVVAIAFGFATSWMLGKLVVRPVQQLRRAASEVEAGNLDIHIDLLCADEFGHLINSFNSMVEGLRQREHLQQTFGRHVGQEAARQIIRQGDQLTGREQVITVMFVDVRNFTQYSSNHSPSEVVSALNVFFREAVECVESHGGMVNKFLGDGFMAIFGVGANTQRHAQDAVDSAMALRACVQQSTSLFHDAGWDDLQIGIGINTGPAVVGSIGSPKRQEYTAIGDTVNVAARVEAATKLAGHNLLITESTKSALVDASAWIPLPPQLVKGKDQPLRLFAPKNGS